MFDAPEVAGDWPRRIEFARLAGVEVVSFRVAQSTAAAFDYMREIQARGGEGAMARKPGLRYSPGRTAEMLKLKKTTHRNPDAKSEKANFRALANQILATI